VVDGGAPDGGGKKPAPSGRPTATATAPAYDGPRLPGFAAKPAWSLATGRTAPGALDLGGTLLFAKGASGAYLATVRLTPVGGGTARTVTCTEEGADCAYDPRTGLIGAARATAPPVPYGYTTAEDGTEHGLAVDPRTREVLAEYLPVDHVPAVDETTGYGHLSTTDGFHAFAPAG
jgi:hypothetical protein